MVAVVKRAAAKVAREIADAIEEKPLVADYAPVTRADLQRWLLLLAPPQRRRAPTHLERKAHRASVKELDDLFRALIQKRDGMRCRRCKKERNLQVHHIFTRRYHRLRWNPLNGMLICGGCHIWMHEAGTEKERAAFFEEQLGTRAYLSLAALKNGSGRAPDHRLVKIHLEKELG